VQGLTPLMEASAAGHAITVHFFLQHVSSFTLSLSNKVSHHRYHSLCSLGCSNVPCLCLIVLHHR